MRNKERGCRIWLLIQKPNLKIMDLMKKKTELNCTLLVILYIILLVQ